MLPKLIAMLLCVGTYAAGQTPTKVKLYVNCTCNDMVGNQYATSLRDAIARSPRYELASSPSFVVGKSLMSWWALSIVTVDDSDETTDPGHKSAISIVLRFNDAMVSQHVQTCGVKVIDHCAAITLASADGDIQEFFATATAVEKKLSPH